MRNNIQISDGDNNTKIVHVKGSISIENNKIFQNSIFNLMDNGVRKIVLDFEDLIIIDSLGISTLIILAKIMKENGGEYIIINCKEQILSLLKPINLEYLVKIYKKSEPVIHFNYS